MRLEHALALKQRTSQKSPDRDGRCGVLKIPAGFQPDPNLARVDDPGAHFHVADGEAGQEVCPVAAEELVVDIQRGRLVGLKPRGKERIRLEIWRNITQSREKPVADFFLYRCNFFFVVVGELPLALVDTY